MNWYSLIAGPCAVESLEQVLDIARSVKASGATALRGGAFKARTSSRDFQGLGEKGIELLLEAGREVNLPVVTEIMDASQLEFYAHVDILQVGARSMQNFTLLKELSHFGKPVLLKRGLSASVDEVVESAGYLLDGGTCQVVLCERGIRTFERTTRNTLDLGGMLALQERTQLPVIVDPSHAAGVARYVTPLACAAIAAGADGLMVEVHNEPAASQCDSDQALTLEEFETLAAWMR